MFLSAAEIQECNELIDEAFNTFKELITVYKAPTVTYINPGADFNFVFGEEQPASSAATYIVNSGQFWATIEYVDQYDNNQFRFAPNDNPVQLPRPNVKISVSGEAANNFLREAERVVLDNRSYILTTDEMRRGLLGGRNYSDFWLTLQK